MPLKLSVERPYLFLPLPCLLHCFSSPFQRLRSLQGNPNNYWIGGFLVNDLWSWIQTGEAMFVGGGYRYKNRPMRTWRFRPGLLSILSDWLPGSPVCSSAVGDCPSGEMRCTRLLSNRGYRWDDVRCSQQIIKGVCETTLSGKWHKRRGLIHTHALSKLQTFLIRDGPA